MKDYKNTLLMPETAFTMRANLREKESFYQNKWLKDDLYQEVINKNIKNSKFILHDGPPYANGPLHVGHALNKIIKDIIVRQKSMLGYYSPYIPGWDTHGLPIENKIIKRHNNDKDTYDILKIRKEAATYALSQVEIQKKQFQSLSLFADFKSYYLTLDKNYEAKQLEIFKKMALDNLIFKTLKPVYWSPSSQSALAEAEVIYQNHVSPSVYVAFDIIKGNNIIENDNKIIIWTTTPWTLVANSGVSIDPKLDYILVKHDDKKYIVAKDCLNRVAEACKWIDYEILKSFKGKEILGIQYRCPVIKENSSIVVVGHHVNTDNGSGLVHNAALFGEDDFIIAKKNNLKQIMHINDDGTLNNIIPEYEGKFYLDVNKDIGLKLDKEGNLLSLKFLKHSYPHDWRTKKPIMYRATPQWFVSISKIKNQILKEIEKLDTKQDWVIKRMKLMIEGRDDWCISRQRAWGVPIIIFYDKDKNPIIDEKIFDYVISLIKEHGSNIWYKKSANELLPEEHRNKGYTKEKDIMDVWFDSGSSYHAVDIPLAKAPYDLYIEGSDQYRGWFNSSLISSVAFNGKAPYKQLVSHGFVLDQKNEKMSKSKGNVIDPLKIIKQNGAEILRLWCANSEYFNDISISENIIKQNVELYRKIRGTLRYMLGNLHDFDIEKDIPTDIEEVHLLILEKLNVLKFETINNYSNYNFIKVIKEINSFIVFLSTFYFDIARDTLYTAKANSKSRRSFQYVIYLITESLLKILAPILPVTIEEAYQAFNGKNKLSSVHLLKFITADEPSYILSKKWKEFFTLKKEVNKLIEEAKTSKLVKKSNEIRLFINNNSTFINSLDLKTLLIIGDIKKTNLKTYVETFNSIKCMRCWNHFNKEDIIDDICKNCNNIIN